MIVFSYSPVVLLHNVMLRISTTPAHSVNELENIILVLCYVLSHLRSADMSPARCRCCHLYVLFNFHFPGSIKLLFPVNPTLLKKPFTFFYYLEMVAPAKGVIHSLKGKFQLVLWAFEMCLSVSLPDRKQRAKL